VSVVLCSKYCSIVCGSSSTVDIGETLFIDPRDVSLGVHLWYCCVYIVKIVCLVKIVE
jgi:hypothetical protein